MATKRFDLDYGLLRLIKHRKSPIELCYLSCLLIRYKIEVKWLYDHSGINGRTLQLVM